LGQPANTASGYAVCAVGAVLWNSEQPLILTFWFKESLEKAQKWPRDGIHLKAKPWSSPGAIAIHRLSKKDEETADWFSLDFLVVTSLLKEAWETRWQVDGKRKIWVVSRGGLILLKSLRASGQDLDDIQKLKDGLDES